MKKRLLALLLALAMMLCLFAACGDSTESATETTAEPAAEAAPAAEAEPADDGTFVTPCGMTYPLEGEDLKVTYWNTFMTFLEDLTTNNDLPCIPMIKDATGVQLEFVEVSVSAATEQFQLMIASGEYTDVLKLNNYYTGGESQAYEDEVIIDLTDSLPVNAPDYWELLNQQPESAVKSIMVDDMFVTLNGIKNGSYTDRGLAIRYDLLTEMGLTFDDITTTESFTQFLYDAKETYNMEYTLAVGTQGHFYSDMMGIATTGPLFDTPLVDITSSTSISNYVDNGKVVSAYVGDNYREYIKWFVQLYQDGLFDQDFYISQDSDTSSIRIGQGQTMVWPSGADTLDNVLDYVDEANQNADIEAMPAVMQSADYVNTWGSTTSLIDLGYSVTVCCEDPELPIKFFNYFFTDPGYILVNFGEEGVSFEYDENGEPHFTELVTNNPDLSPMGAAGYYGLNEIPYLKSESKLFDAYSQAARDAIDLWTQDVEDAGRVYPTSITLTTEESNSINGKMNDCLSYGQEMILKFLTGALDVNDDAAWQDYKDNMEKLGLNDVLAVYQTAYDDYLAGER